MDNPLQVLFAVISCGGVMCGFGFFFSFVVLHPISVLFYKSPVSGNFPTMIKLALVVLIDLTCLPYGSQTSLRPTARFVNLHQPQNNSSFDEKQWYCYFWVARCCLSAEEFQKTITKLQWARMWQTNVSIGKHRFLNRIFFQLGKNYSKPCDAELRTDGCNLEKKLCGCH